MRSCAGPSPLYHSASDEKLLGGGGAGNKTCPRNIFLDPLQLGALTMVGSGARHPCKFLGVCQADGWSLFCSLQW